MRALKTIRKVVPQFSPLCFFSLITPAQYGGLDKYVLNTKADLLGWEGMRLRVAVREAQERNALEASSSPSQAPTPGASPKTRPIPNSSRISHFRSSSPIDHRS